ncbi:MAG: hypothetical protein KDJ52_31550 [Anaerolineae bacterium]|nr:hypothetical protein [Anaerolineae bacterium]
MLNFKTLIEEINELEKQVYLEGDQIIIDVCYKYPIAVSECDTPEKLLAWVYHLCEKNWMTTPVIRRFIALASSHHRLDLR